MKAILKFQKSSGETVEEKVVLKGLDGSDGRIKLQDAARKVLAARDKSFVLLSIRPVPMR